MRIGEFAREAGLHVETVRYYERRGLITMPARSQSGYREYGSEDVARLRFVTHGKALGFTLDEIRELMRLDATGGDRGEVRRIAEERLADVERRMQALADARDALRDLVARCTGEGTAAGCPIIERILHGEN